MLPEKGDFLFILIVLACHLESAICEDLSRIPQEGLFKKKQSGIVCERVEIYHFTQHTCPPCHFQSQDTFLHRHYKETAAPAKDPGRLGDESDREKKEKKEGEKLGKQ